MWVGSQGREAPLLSLREASKTTIFLLGGGAGKGQFSLYPDSQVRHRLGFKFRPDICPVTHISFPSRDLTSSLFGHTQRDVLGAPAWGRGHTARAPLTPHALRVSQGGVAAPAPRPCPHPFPGAPRGPPSTAARAPLPTPTDKTVRPPLETRPAEPEAEGRAGTRGPSAAAAALLSPAPSWCPGGRGGVALRAGRGGARAASAGVPRGWGRGTGWDPLPKKPRGRSGAARPCARAAKFGSGARGFASCVWGTRKEGDCPLPSGARTPALRAAADVRGRRPPLLAPVRAGRTGAGPRAAPCWRATSASRDCPPRKLRQLVSSQGAARGARAPERGGSGVGDARGQWLSRD